MPKSELADVALTLLAETDKAYKVTEGKGSIWLPKSLVEYDKPTGMFTMPVWLASDKGLAGY